MADMAASLMDDKLDQILKAIVDIRHEAHIRDLIDRTTLQTVDTVVQVDLNTPITEQEIRGAIRGSSTIKTPGLNGLPAGFFKAYEDLLVPQMLELCQCTLAEGRLPKTR
ncbi:hypothetical protein NDU88_004632 [Pleurodeles waltl]|uniref:Reverse transcriptase n=1 Tax=Pleurodeles waltl TaxID=8319 RepID=A0AAV7W5I2_PLEWA|nr:hypothetical protein NDU88_004632 [Pleurodeles waltl]